MIDQTKLLRKIAQYYSLITKDQSYGSKDN